MGKKGFADRFFGMLSADQCPDCGGSIITRVIKEEGPAGGDGLSDFSCSACSFRLVSCGQLYSPKSGK